MSDYDKLMKIVDKQDDKHKGLPRYDVRLTNGEIYFVYVKKSLFGF